jgi:diguanylate cyclase (GGDEF)-like protein/hemerythrin-like metal-binding protein
MDGLIMIEWNDGLDIGVKALDDDHKQLLKIINTLSLAIDNDKPQNEIYDIFLNLEKLVEKHFQREEALLKQCAYDKLDKHMEFYKYFSDNLSILKEKLLKSDNEDSSKEVISFLIDWLFDHIIQDNISIMDVFEKCNLYEEKKYQKISLIQRVLNKITKTVSFTNKLLFSALIPLAGMLALILIILLNNYIKYESMMKTATITNIIFDINNLAHVMQVERGLSCGFLSSDNNKFRKKLDKQRDIVNNAIELFNKKTKIIDNTKLEYIRVNLDIYKKDIVTLKNFREMVDSKNLSQDLVVKHYTDIIKNILEITSKISMLDFNIKLSSAISNLSSLLYFKETLGLKRAIGTAAIEHKGKVSHERDKFIQLLASQKIYLNGFRRTATKEEDYNFNQIIYSNLADKISFYENKIINNNFENIDSVIWFNLMSKLINEIKLYEDKLLQNIEKNIEKTLQDNFVTMCLWMIFAVLFFMFTAIVIYIFTKTSRVEIYEFIKAIKNLANGERSLKLAKLEKSDEIAQMYDAYELTRQKLLKGDIYAQLYLYKKEKEIKEQQKRNMRLEEMASIDTLTGCVNRRKFDEISKLELGRAIRYKTDLTFLMLDIDHFKSVNDTYGHGVGDEVLKHFSSICIEMARELDIVARVGGEEFVVILPQTDEDGGFVFAERFRKQISKSSVVVEEHTIKYSVSIGISGLDENTKDVATILKKADKALYEAKEFGRNRTIIYGR